MQSSDRFALLRHGWPINPLDNLESVIGCGAPRSSNLKTAEEREQAISAVITLQSLGVHLSRVVTVSLLLINRYERA